MSENNTSRKNDRAPLRRFADKSYKFYLIEPPINANSSNLAEKLIAMKDVEEVFVTDGDYGFIVKARFSSGKNDATYNYIARHLGANFGRVTSYYQYKK